MAGSGLQSRPSDSSYALRYGEDFQSSPEDMNNFAKWAFSAEGLPNLQVLAYGDFSYAGRYDKFNLLLCRCNSGEGYQPLTPSQVTTWEFVQGNMDMLAACPYVDMLE
ncbi:hypothetical protein BDW74DRAFT_173248 [Aspergillus multicolor]|uniref:uncharacterized protein n=1 Tax=Aspergillus multicolor TaxID=41759 RepID=UPI003CCCA9CB